MFHYNVVFLFNNFSAYHCFLLLGVKPKHRSGWNVLLAKSIQLIMQKSGIWNKDSSWSYHFVWITLRYLYFIQCLTIVNNWYFLIVCFLKLHFNPLEIFNPSINIHFVHIYLVLNIKFVQILALMQHIFRCSQFPNK